MSESIHIVCPDCEAINRVRQDRLIEGPKCGRCGKGLFQGAAVHLGQHNFDRHLNRNELPLLVDFWAPWCGPCQAMAPVFEKAAARLEPHVRLAKVDTEREQELAMRFAIRSIPTLALFAGGREIDRVAGAMDLEGLISFVRHHLKP